MSVGRQLPKHVQAIFDDPKYGAGIHRRIERENAKRLFQDEFNMTEEQASAIFETFDADNNGYMSLREFREFYGLIGNRALEILDLFEEMDTNKNGQLEEEEAREGLKNLKTKDDKAITEDEINFCIKTNRGPDGVIDIRELGRMLLKLKIIAPDHKALVNKKE